MAIEVATPVSELFTEGLVRQCDYKIALAQAELDRLKGLRADLEKHLTDTEENKLKFRIQLERRHREGGNIIDVDGPLADALTKATNEWKLHLSKVFLLLPDGSSHEVPFDVWEKKHPGYELLV